MHIAIRTTSRYVVDSLRGDLDSFLTLGLYGQDEDFPENVFTEGMERLPERVHRAVTVLHTVYTAVEEKDAAVPLLEFLKLDLARHTEQMAGKDQLLESDLLDSVERIGLLTEIDERIKELNVYITKLEALV